MMSHEEVVVVWMVVVVGIICLMLRQYRIAEIYKEAEDDDFCYCY